MKTSAYAAQTATSPLVGIPTEPLALNVGSLIFGRRSLSGSLIGGIKETQEMLDFCGEDNITSDRTYSHSEDK
jgi:D-arabinose 1-dehydrogenase-like Zn-dependent alcohol dehydrogenase